LFAAAFEGAQTKIFSLLKRLASIYLNHWATIAEIIIVFPVPGGP
jgi:hypothetical protein